MPNSITEKQVNREISKIKSSNQEMRIKLIKYTEIVIKNLKKRTALTE